MRMNKLATKLVVATTITASVANGLIGGQLVQQHVAAEEAKVTKVVANQTKVAVSPVTKTQQVKLTASFDNKTTKAVQDVATWTSSDEKIVKVEKGLFTFVGHGQAQVTYTYGGQTGTIDVNTEIASLTLDKKVYVPKGERVTFIATAKFADGKSLDVTKDAQVKFDSASLMAPVIATMTVTYGTKTATAKVDPNPASMTVNKTSVAGVLNQTETLSAVVKYVDGSTETITDQLALAIQSGGEFVQVERNTVTFKGYGVAKLQASYKGKTVAITATSVLKSLTPSVTTLLTSPGKKTTITLKATAADGKPLAVKDGVKWSTPASSEELVVTNGEINVLKPVKTTVTAEYAGSKTTITVDGTVKSLKPTKTAVLAGVDLTKSQEVKVEAYFADNTHKDVTADAKWTTAAKPTDLVVDKGVISFKSYTNANVVAEYFGAKATITTTAVLKSVAVVDEKGVALTKVTGAPEPYFSSPMPNPFPFFAAIPTSRKVKVMATGADNLPVDVTAMATMKVTPTAPTTNSAFELSNGTLRFLDFGKGKLDVTLGAFKKTFEIDSSIQKIVPSATKIALSPFNGVMQMDDFSFDYVLATGQSINVGEFENPGWTVDKRLTATVTSSSKNIMVTSHMMTGMYDIRIDKPEKATITISAAGQSAKIEVDATVKQLQSLTPVIGFQQLLHGPIYLELQAVYVNGDVTGTHSTSMTPRIDYRDVKWTTSNKAIVVSDENKLTVTGFVKGTVTATYGGKTTTFTVDTTAQSLELQYKNVTISKTNNQQRLPKAVLVMSNGYRHYLHEDVKMTVANPKVVTIENGSIKPVGIGKTTITFDYRGIKTKMEVTVFE